jgi:O-antigen/teichoic acid export membrane protein
MFQSALFNGLARIATAVFNFVVIIVLSQALAPADRGTAGLYGAILAAAQLLADFAGGSTIPYLRQQYRLAFLLGTYRWWSAVACTVVVVGIGHFKSLPALHVVALWLAALANCQATVHQHALLSCQNLVWFNRLMVLPAAGMAVAVAACWIAGNLNVESFLIALIINWLLTSWVGWSKLKKAHEANAVPAVEHSIRPVFAAGALNQSTQLLGLLNTRLAYLVLPVSSLGAFSNALALSEALLIVPGALGQVMYANLVQGSGQRDRRALKRPLLTALPMVAVGVLALLVLPASFYRGLLGPANGGVGPILLVLAPAMLCYSVYIILSYWQSAFGRFWLNLIPIAAGLCFSACYYLRLHHASPSVSAVVATLAASLVINALIAVVLFLFRVGQNRLLRP